MHLSHFCKNMYKYINLKDYEYKEMVLINMEIKFLELSWKAEPKLYWEIMAKKHFTGKQ